MKITIQLEKWVNNGFTLGYNEGIPIFVLGGIPGELVQIEIFESNPKYKKGKVCEILEPSIFRSTPPCPNFLRCGGCSFQHLTYEEEIKIKENLLRSDLKFSGLINDSYTIHIYKGKEYNYRNNVQFKIQSDEIGFFEFNSNKIVPLPKNGCFLLDEKLNKYTNDHLNYLPKNGKLRVDSNSVVHYGEDNSTFIVKGKSIVVPKNGFFQINTELIDEWINRTILHNVDNSEILELFCGVGTLSIFLADKCSRLIGYEVSELSVNFARKNLSSYPHVKIKTKDLYKENITDKFINDFICIANPPRNGLGKLIKKFILTSKPHKLIYSSCNYTSLIPDLKDLSQIYKITSIDILDFFPRTPYFETLVCLEKKG